MTTAAQTFTLDLEAHRCPAAMVMARRMIEEFNGNSQEGDRLIIQTIEPSFSRDLAQFLNSEFEGIAVVQSVSAEIPAKSMEKWRDNFDEEDWQGVEQSCYVLAKGV